MRGVLKDPRVEWRLYETAESLPWRWEVLVDGRRHEGRALFSDSATEDLERAARVLLGEGESSGSNRPCVICDKPARLGEPTCSQACQGYLDKARAELPPDTQ